MRHLAFLVPILAAWSGSGRAQTLLADLAPGSNVVFPLSMRPLTSTPSFALFVDNDLVIWRSDGTTAGTVASIDSVSGWTDGTATSSFAFLLSGCLNGRSLWRTDGTNAGTEEIAAFGSVEAFVGLSTRVVLAATAVGGSSSELWAVEPDGRTVVRLGVGITGTGTRLVAAHGRAFFNSAGQLWETDGTAAATRQLTRDGSVEAILPTRRGLGLLESVGTSKRVRYWALDGSLNVLSTAATRLVGATGDYLVFAEPGSGINTRVLASDGLGPVRLVSDTAQLLNSRASSGDLYLLLGTGGAYSIAVTDGGPAVPLTNVGNVTLLGTHEGALLFENAFDPAVYALDRSGLRLLVVGARGSLLGSTPRGTLLQLSTLDSVEISVLDAAGLHSLRQLPTGTPLGSLPPARTDDLPGAASRGGIALLTVPFGGFAGIWRTDGTPEGTSRLVPASYGEVVAGPRRFYFSTGSRLYESDGTPAGTVLLRDASPYGVRNLTVAGDGVVAVFARQGADEILRVGADRVVHQLPLSRSNLSVRGLTVGDLGVYVSVRDGADGALERVRPNATAAERFATFPGTGAAPVLVGSLGGKIVAGAAGLVAVREADGAQTVLNATQPTLARKASTLAYYHAADGLWRTDGTTGGTFRLTSVLPLEPRLAGERLFFRGTDGQGSEPWVSDGTLAGTHRIADLQPGACDSYPTDFAAAGDSGHVVFAATTPLGQRQLWSSDGTAAGTRLVGRVRALGSSNPGRPIAVGNRIVAWADDGIHGMEPWAFDARPIGAYQQQVLSASCGRTITLLAAPRLGAAGFGFETPSTSVAAAAFLGVRATTATLPGLTACELRVADIFTVLAPQRTATTERIALPIPADPALVGLTLVAQFADLRLSLSDALYVVVGR
ncbi:MAG: hypothetical protein R3F56_21655 [Planctomycetota bacterium]